MTELRMLIVGAHFRPPAKQVLGVLRPGTALRLEAEPENPYDEKAVKVMIDQLWDKLDAGQIEALTDVVDGTGVDLEELLESGEPLQLGYLPDEDGKAHQKAGGGPGNRQAGVALLNNRVTDVMLAFGPDGKPQAVITVTSDD